MGLSVVLLFIWNILNDCLFLPIVHLSPPFIVEFSFCLSIQSIQRNSKNQNNTKGKLRNVSACPFLCCSHSSQSVPTGESVSFFSVDRYVTNKAAVNNFVCAYFNIIFELVYFQENFQKQGYTIKKDRHNSFCYMLSKYPSKGLGTVAFLPEIDGCVCLLPHCFIHRMCCHTQ